MGAQTIRYSFPTMMDVGQGAIQNLPEWVALHGKKALVVTDPGMLGVPAYQQAIDVLSTANVPYAVFSEISPDPKDTDALRGAQVFNAESCDLLIGIGGGSAIDGAKAIGLMATHTGNILDYDDAKGGSDRINNTLPPLIAIPTTAGTGSEVGRSTVVVDTSCDVKRVIFSPYMMPVVALLDPELHVGMPKWLTAATGMDALTHNIEALLSLGYHPMADAIALEGIRLIGRSLVRAVENGSDLEARRDMAVAASMGATAFQKGLGVIHSLAHPCSTIAKVHHGLANAVIIETGLRFNADVSQAPLASVARTLQLGGSTEEEQCLATIEWVANLRNTVGIPSRLRDVGVKREMLPAMGVQAFEDPCHQCNPKPVSQNDINELYAKVL